jgi:polyisoprenoid-binding protein YceI
VTRIKINLRQLTGEMEMKLKLLSILATSAFLASTVLVIAADTYKIDKDHAWVNFSINHAGWSAALGKFRTVSGDIVFDKVDVTKSSVKVEIDATSIDTNFADRDKDLSSPDFLNTAEFPKINFESTSVEKTGEKTGKITGNLTIIGVTKPVTLDAIWNAEQPRPWDATAIISGFSASGVVKPADFGIGKVAEYGLGPDIKLMIEIEAQKQ